MQDINRQRLKVRRGWRGEWREGEGVVDDERPLEALLVPRGFR